MNATMRAPVYDAATVGKMLGLGYSDECPATFGPPPEPRDGYVTFFDLGLSIIRLGELRWDLAPIFYPQDWYEDEAFARAEAQWEQAQNISNRASDQLRGVPLQDRNAVPNSYRQLQTDVQRTYFRSVMERVSLETQVPIARVLARLTETIEDPLDTTGMDMVIIDRADQRSCYNCS